MDTFEIYNELKDMECFGGIYPIDKLPEAKINKVPFGIIINLDPSFMRGSHWVALYIEDKRALYFDPLGFPNMSNELYEFIIKNKLRDIFYNKYQLQNSSSSVCGAYCVMFLKMLCNGFNYLEFLKLFSANTQKNDMIAIEIL